MLTALLFDLDGTLTDTDTLHLQAFRQLLREHDGRELSQAQFDAGQRPRQRRAVRRAVQRRQCRTVPGVGRPQGGCSAMSPSLEPMPGLLRLLEHAQAHAIGMCVVTNAPRLNAEHMLNAMGLGQR
jgi:beta-phosphoglucomutase-like phosphatase (HAD superfamily)